MSRSSIRHFVDEIRTGVVLVQIGIIVGLVAVVLLPVRLQRGDYRGPVARLLALASAFFWLSVFTAFALVVA